MICLPAHCCCCCCCGKQPKKQSAIASGTRTYVRTPGAHPAMSLARRVAIIQPHDDARCSFYSLARSFRYMYYKSRGTTILSYVCRVVSWLSLLYLLSREKSLVRQLSPFFSLFYAPRRRQAINKCSSRTYTGGEKWGSAERQKNG
jgi:hypothetical protein